MPRSILLGFLPNGNAPQWLQAQAEEELAVAEARIEKLKGEKADALSALAEQEARAAAAGAELAEARAAHGRTAAEATQHLQARIGELTAARDSAVAEAERLREQVRLLCLRKFFCAFKGPLQCCPEV